ncbi:MAG: hypothetical protein LBR31_01705 [Desulfovibrio sp.]|jgi:hypothetical protein|nr:hypothetical protein [Desulfovibrio sp.]
MLIPGLFDKYSATPEEAAKANVPTVGWGGYMGASASEAFTRTSTDALLTESRVLAAEEKAYGQNAPGFQERMETGEAGFSDFFTRPTGKAPVYISKEDWNESNPFFRKGVEWREGMTEERARIYAEGFDESEDRKKLLGVGQEQYGFARGTLPGFFAGMLGSLPDPVNLIPFGGGLARGKGFLAGARAGALEGAAVNVVVDALVMKDLQSRGEELGFADVALDLAFGAALGGFLGGAGGWLSARRANRTDHFADASKAAFDAVPDGFFDVFQDSSANWTTPWERTAAAADEARPALRHLNVETMDDVYALAEQTQERFYSDVESWANETGGEALFRTDGESGLRSLKNRKRAERELPEYNGDPARVVDILGGTIIYDTRAQVEAAASRIKERVEAAGGVVNRDKNRFEKTAGDGYRDYQLNYRYPNGFTVELLLNTRAMTEAKNGVGHAIYEAVDAIDRIANDPNATPEDILDANRISKWLEGASKAFYDSTGEQSNATASSSDITELSRRIEAYISLLAGSKVYREAAPLLERIRKILPSSESTYGIPSQSRKLSTNIGSLGPDASHEAPPVPASRPSMNRAINGLENMEEPPSDRSKIKPDSGEVNTSGRLSGEKVEIYTSEGEDAAYYEVRELEEVIPSHDPNNGFARREDYPAIAQERPYHSVTGEQDKVRRNAREFRPMYLLTNNPDASNGPPVITSDGVVLGGNSRTMTLGLVYDAVPQKAAEYKERLIREAGKLGIDGAAVAGMERPILVRVLEHSLTPEEMAVKSRLYNQSQTQALQAIAEGVSKARLISPETLAVFTKGMEDFDSLREYLGSTSSRKLVAALEKDGVLEQTQLDRIIETSGKLNEEGKTLVENALRGIVVSDYDTLASAPASALKKLDKAVPALTRLKARGEGWDLSGTVTAALRQLNQAQSRGMPIDSWFGQLDLVQVDPAKHNPAVQALALLLDKGTQKENQARFELFARLVERENKGQGTMVSRKDGSPAQAFTKAFLKPLAVVDGEIISGFDPKGNALHAALQYAHDKGGSGHSVNTALEKLPKTKAGKEMARLLAKYSGAVNIYEPKLGNYFDVSGIAALDASVAIRPEGAFDAARMNVHGDARQALLNGMELAAGDLAAGRDVDVSQVAGLPEAIAKARNSVSPGENHAAPDFSPAQPETFTPAPNLKTADSSTYTYLRDQGINPDTGLSVEEIMVNETLNRDASLLRPSLAEETAALNEAREAEASRQKIEEQGYSMLSCVLGASE